MSGKLSFFFLFALLQSAFGQNATIVGRVFNSINNEPIPFAGVVLQTTTITATSDENGDFKMLDVPPGVYNISAQCAGFRRATVFEVQVNTAAPAIVMIPMTEDITALNDVLIAAKPFERKEESPLSAQTIGATEIKRSPGGNRDISKVIQLLPGVASTPSFRNDIIIRGGAPNENRFFLDGIEVPNINHFSTQGSSGGPVGMINVDFLREVDFYSSAFPANRGNALSSVFAFKFRDGNSEKRVFTSTVGASDIGLTAEGPLGKNANYIFSARRSYLQFLFSVLGLPFLPTYNDAQYKIKWRITDKDEINFLGIGAIDDFVLNLNANETEAQRYFLNVIPVNSQWNYTSGATYTHYRENNYTFLVISRNYLFNRAYKYRNNDGSNEANKILDYRSSEAENKLRLENVWRKKGWKSTCGLSFENVGYTNKTFSSRALPWGIVRYDFTSELVFNKYAAFAQVSRSFRNDNISVSAGMRMDGADYSAEAARLWKQFSPRASFSWEFMKSVSFNAAAGRYYQLPAYTVIGYRDSAGYRVNNAIKYISCDHVSAGFEKRIGDYTRVTLEGFAKQYDHYPFLTEDSVSLANLGSDFGVIGNAPAVSVSRGRARGVELMVQRKLNKNVYGILSYTFVRSEFTDKHGTFVPAAWDNRHIFNLAAGVRLKRNWELAFKWRYLGGAPYTPFNVALSVQQPVWDITGQGIPDYNKLNTLRLPSVHQMDVRIDKKYYFKKVTMEFYADIQNVYNFQAVLPSYLSVVKDDMGVPVPDPQNPGSYQPRYLENTSGSLIPTIGVTLEF